MLPEFVITTLLLAGAYAFPASPSDQIGAKSAPKAEYFFLQPAPAIKAQPQFVQTYSFQSK